MYAGMNPVPERDVVSQLVQLQTQERNREANSKKKMIENLPADSFAKFPRGPGTA